MHTARLPALDSLRGLAALLVVFVHQMGVTQLPAGEHWQWVGAYGGFAVPLFFALSAFSLALGYAHRLNTAEALRQFMVQRFFRIAPLFYVMLAVSATYRLVAGDGHVDVTTLMLNLSFLFALTPGHYESIVWAGWSLGVEMLMYVVFPLLLLFCRRWWQSLLLLAAATVASHLAFGSAVQHGYAEHEYASKSFTFNLPYFLFGFLAWQVHQALPASGRQWSLPIRITVAVLVTAGIYGMTRSGPFGAALLRHWGWWSAVHYQTWGLAFAVLILATVRFGIWGWDNRVTRWLGVWAYGIYLLHVPVILSLKPWYAQVYALPTADGMRFLLSTLSTLVPVLILAALSWRWLESPIMRWRQTQPARLQRDVAASVAPAPIAHLGKQERRASQAAA